MEDRKWDQALHASGSLSQEDFRAAFAEAPVGMALSTPDGRILEVNQACLNMFGFGPEDFDSRDSERFTHPDDIELTRQFVASLQDGSRRSATIEKRYIRKDGRVLWARASATMRWDQGRPVQMVAVLEDITERRRAEEALRKSEERLNFALAAGGGIGAWDWDVPNNLVFADERFARLFGVDPERAASGTPIEAFVAAIHRDDSPRVAASIKQAVETGSDFSEEYRVIQEDGSARWIYARGRCHLDDSGGANRFPGVVFDITERKTRELRDTFLLRLDDGVRPLTDPDKITQTAARLLNEHLDVNRCAYADVEEDEDTFNLSGDYNRGVPSIVGRYTFAQFGAECLRLMRENRPYLVEDSEVDTRTEAVREAYRATGMRSAICVPLHKAGRFVAAMAVHQITPRRWRADEVELVLLVANRCWESIERSRVTRELAASEDQFRTLANTIDNLAWMAHADGFLFWYNRRWYEYTGTTPEQMEGWGWQTVHDPDLLPDVMKRWTQSIQTGEPFEMVFPLRAADGRFRAFLTRAQPVKDNEGKVARWFGSNTDITEQQETEAELRRMNRELEEFAYVASHDLQEPLRVVSIYTQLILKQITDENQKLTQYANFVKQGVTRMDALITDLLTFSRTIHDSDKVTEEADLSIALREALSILQDRIDETGAEVTFETLPAAPGETQQWMLVFQNLLSNALKYSKKETPPRIRIFNSKRGDQQIISVSDEGIGFDPAYAERIFGLFKRLHKTEYPGTGLGLAICQRIVERYGGEIWAEGRPGEGSTFSFSLDRPGDDPASAAIA